VAFSPDGRQLLSSSTDGTLKIWKADAGDLLATIFAAGDDDWLLITPAGFFNASSDQASEMMSMVRGMVATSIGQVYEHLYRPELIEHLLKGDPEGRYTDEASKLNLQKILDSGPAPQIETLPERKTERAGDQVKLALRIVDTGGGIGDKIVWRVNGVVQGVATAAQPSQLRVRGGYRVVAQTLRVDTSKKNVVEVTAYNAAGLLATEPYRIEVDAFGATTEARPRMHVLAAGVSAYAQKDWSLQYAVQDARTLASTLKSVASGLYDEVKVTTLFDGAVTAAGLETAINSIAAEVQPADVFVLFIAGHGRNVAGTYYFLPQDLKFDGGRTIMSHGINQDQWQRWLAKIAAQKSILIFDTCESSIAAGLTRGDREREAAMNRLRHATGRSVITAARQAAYEGYNGHGVLTYVILEALTKPDTGGDDEVDLYRLASHVDRQVPIISERLFGVAQRPHNKVEGNFPIGIRKAGLTSPTTVSAIPATPTHVLIRAMCPPRRWSGCSRAICSST